jgi:hypothetical protein
MVIQKPEPVAAPIIPPVTPVTEVQPPPVSPPVVPPPEPTPAVSPEPPAVSPPVQTKLPEPPVEKPKVPEPIPPTPPPQDSGLVIDKTETPVAAAQVSDDEKKWLERARRLAKALASDLVLYNQDKVDQGLRDGSLAQLLGSEIRRSWEYFCQQIPKHIVEGAGSQLFKEQLNKIVGKGKELFK